jgi:hypothetical protein
MRALQRHGVAVVFVPEPYTSKHCSRLREVAPGKLQRCCAEVRQDLPVRAPDGRVRDVQALVCCPNCIAGRKPEHCDYAGARSIFHDVLDMVAHHDGRHADITSTPDRWALVVEAWERARSAGESEEQEEDEPAPAGGIAQGGQAQAGTTADNAGGSAGGAASRGKRMRRSSITNKRAYELPSSE